jgi:hypothetical protein
MTSLIKLPPSLIEEDLIKGRHSKLYDDLIFGLLDYNI